MYENLLALNTVDPSNQEVITVEDIYVASESAGTQSVSKPATFHLPLGTFWRALRRFHLAIAGGGICYHIAWLDGWMVAWLHG